MYKVTSGMQQLFFYFEKEGVIANIIQNHNVERQVYDNRFGVLASLPFPKYKEYDEFVAERGVLEETDSGKLQEQVKTLLMEGKNILTKLISTEDSARSLTLLPKATLEQLQRIVVMNSLSMTKASMLAKSKEAVAKINLAGSLFWLPLIEVDKKQAKWKLI